MDLSGWFAKEFCTALTVPVAEEIYQLAVADRWEALNKPLNALVQLDEAAQGGPLVVATMYWIDNLKAHMLGGWYPHIRVGASPGSRIRRVCSKQEFVLGTAEADMALSPQELWASSIIDARLGHDKQRWMQKWDEAPEEDFGEYVLMVLSMVATTVRLTERGYEARSVQG